MGRTRSGTGRSRAVRGLMTAALVVGCGSSTPTSSPMVDGGAVADVMADAGPADVGPMVTCNGGAQSGAGGPCQCPTDCTGALACASESMIGAPHGLCLQSCEEDGGAPDGFACRGDPGGTFLVPRCGSGTPGCRAGYACRYTLTLNYQYCDGLCTADSVCEGGHCNLDTGVCEAATTGNGMGAACTRDDQCRSGQCGGAPVYPGGFCLSFCNVQHPACPDDGACILVGRNPAGTEYGQCFPRCTRNADCRAGYQCGRSGSATVCFPML